MYMMPPAYSAMPQAMMGMQNLRRRAATQRQPGEVYRPRTYGSLGTMTPYTDGQDTPGGPRWAGNRIPTAPMAEPMTDPTGLGQRMNALSQLRSQNQAGPQMVPERASATGGEVSDMMDYLRAKNFDRAGTPYPPWRQPGQPMGQASSADADAYVRALQDMKDEGNINAYMDALPGMLGPGFDSIKDVNLNSNSAYDRAVGTLSVMNDAGATKELTRRRQMQAMEAAGLGPRAQQQQKLMGILKQREDVARSRMLQMNPLLALAFQGGEQGGALPSAMQFGAVGMNPALGLDAYEAQQRRQMELAQNKQRQEDQAREFIFGSMMERDGSVDPSVFGDQLNIFRQGGLPTSQGQAPQQGLQSAMKFGPKSKDVGAALDILETTGTQITSPQEARQWLTSNGITLNDLQDIIYEGSGPLGTFTGDSSPIWSSSPDARRRATAKKLMQFLQGDTVTPEVAPAYTPSPIYRGL